MRSGLTSQISFEALVLCGLQAVPKLSWLCWRLHAMTDLTFSFMLLNVHGGEMAY